MTKWRAAWIGMAFAVGLGAITLHTGCAAPTLPIPPPTALVSTPDASGNVTVSGHADPRAYVFVLNERTEVGLIVHADAMGDFSVSIPAVIDDTITVWQMIGNETGQQLHTPVPAR